MALEHPLFRIFTQHKALYFVHNLPNSLIMKLTEGDVFVIPTNKGYGFLQYIKLDRFGVGIVRVLEPVKPANEITQEEVDIPERYTVHFAAGTALRRKIIFKSGIFKIPAYYNIPRKGREKHTIRGEFLGWHIQDLETLKLELKYELSPEDLKLPPSGHPNDTLLREWLENDWRLENWK